MTDINEFSVSDRATSPGELLTQARERAHLTQEQVAQALHMSVAKVKAIENNDYGKMNADTFIRGYLRSYAGLLKIDSASLILAYEQHAIAKGLLPIVEDLPAREQGGRRGWGFIAALIGFLLLLLLISVWFFDNKIAPSPAALPVQPLLPEPGLVVADKSAESATTNDPIPSTATAADQSQVALVDPVQPVIESTSPSDAANVLDRLELSFSDECWLEVSDAQGDVLATDLQRSGSRLTLMGKAPFQVKLGFAAAASITFNGEPVAIAPQAGVKVLTLSVGE